MNISEQLKQRRKQLGLTQMDVAKACGVSKSAVCKWQTSGNDEGIRRSTIKALANVLQIDPAELVLGIVLPKSVMPINQSNIHRIPILGSIRCGEPAYAEQEFIGYVDSTTKCDFALRAVGDSMIGARIHDGDIVFIRKQPTVENGQIAAVAIDDEATLKRVYSLPGGYMMLQAENPKYAPIMVNLSDETQNVRILGLAVAFQGKII